MITQASLKELLRYEPATGNMYWRKSGKKAGCTRRDGYVVIRINKILYLMHRIVWLYHNGDWPEELLDHIDRDQSNHRIENLREVNHSQNKANVYAPLNNTSGHIGVDWIGRLGKWRARAMKKHLGVFSTKQEAIKAVQEYRQQQLTT